MLFDLTDLYDHRTRHAKEIQLAQLLYNTDSMSPLEYLVNCSDEHFQYLYQKWVLEHYYVKLKREMGLTYK
jgi:hypothetical protein